MIDLFTWLFTLACLVGIHGSNLRVEINSRLGDSNPIFTMVAQGGEFRSDGTDGFSDGCMINSGKLQYNKQIQNNGPKATCSVIVSFGGQDYCKCDIGTREAGNGWASYVIFEQKCRAVGGSELSWSSCYKFVSTSGMDSGYAPPCQAQGCRMAFSENYITVRKPDVAPVQKAHVTDIRVSWENIENSKKQSDSTSSFSSSSSSSRDESTDVSATASVSYGPASVSSTFSNSIKTKASKALSSSGSNKNLSEQILCESPTGYRFQQIFTMIYSDGTSKRVEDDLTMCARGPPKCPGDVCGTQDGISDCQCCTPGSGLSPEC